MSKKRTTYSAEFKVKVVLEVLKGEKTLNQISQEYNRHCAPHFSIFFQFQKLE
jgi:transposase-like protein